MIYDNYMNILRKKSVLVLGIFAISLGLFSTLFYLQRAFMQNFDEADHIAAGFFMKNGMRLYSDFFSHHFPLPYYWIHLFTSLWDTPSRAIGIFRLSLLVAYLIVFVLVYLSYKNNRSKISFSLWIVLSSLFFSIYHGNLVLSETFSAIFISAMFSIVVPMLLSWEKISNYKIALLIVFSSCAFWTQPMLGVLLLVPILMGDTWRRRIKIAVFVLLLNLLPVLYFMANGQFNDFWEKAVWFNLAIYPKYFAEDLSSCSSSTSTIICFFRHEFELLTGISNPREIFQFLLHAALILLIISVLGFKNKNYLLAFFLIILSTRVREVKIVTGMPFNFGIYPLLLISALAFSILVVKHFRTRKFLVSILLLFLVLVSYVNIKPILDQSLESGYNYHVFWSYRQDAGQLINSLTREGEPILIYPHDVDLYFFADRFPPDRFLFWFPWINDVEKYKSERVSALKDNPPAVIYLGNTDFRGETDYYQQYFPDLLDGYGHIKDTNIWLRTDLNNRIE